MSKTHGNSHKNDKEHHLYAIHDSLKDDIFKYGISSDPIDEDGLSRRIKRGCREYDLPDVGVAVVVVGLVLVVGTSIG